MSAASVDRIVDRFVDRFVVASIVAVVLFALGARMHDVAAYPAMYDYDAGGHAVNALAISEGHLPNVRSWSGSHPPLYYVVGAALWAVLPESVPLHVTLRWISILAWTGTVGLVWRTLRRVGFGVDAGVVAAVLLGIPGIVIASCMMTNDALCAFFVTATLTRLVDTRDRSAGVGHAAVTGTLAGLAALTKATGIVTVPTAVLFYAWHARREPRRALRNALTAGLIGGALGGLHYVRLLLSLSGSPYLILGTRAGSIEKETLGAVVYAVAPTHWSFHSLAALFHASLWGDPLGVYLHGPMPSSSRAMSVAGLLVAGMFAVGTIRIWWARDVARRTAPAFVLGAAYALGLFPTIWIGAAYILTKINYMLPLALPVAVVLALGLGWPTGATRTTLRLALMVVAAGGVAFTWYGWWTRDAGEATPVAVAIDGHGGGARVVARYFEKRGRDPIRAVTLLAPEALAHDLRLARIVGVNLKSEVGLTAEADAALELARARVAWLDLYNMVRWIQPIAAALDVHPLTVSQERDTADVTVRVSAGTPSAPPGGRIGSWPFPPFEQRFVLRRNGNDWRITAIEQHGVVDANAVQAFVANPSLDGIKRLRTLGWKPDWEAAFMSTDPSTQ